jgi:hypothetical protein
MDTKTGAIAHFEKESDAIRAGFKQKLTSEQVKIVSPMNRKARRKWAAEQRRAKKP